MANLRHESYGKSLGSFSKSLREKEKVSGYRTRDGKEVGPYVRDKRKRQEHRLGPYGK